MTTDDLESGKIMIAVLTHGFVFVGELYVLSDFYVLKNQRNIRKYGTDSGLGGLMDGPKKETVLDKGGDMLIPKPSVVFLLAVDQIAWGKALGVL